MGLGHAAIGGREDSTPSVSHGHPEAQSEHRPLAFTQPSSAAALISGAGPGSTEDLFPVAISDSLADPTFLDLYIFLQIKTSYSK